MILQDLFESGMKRVLDAMREVKTLTDDEFLKVHGMSKSMWVRTHWPVIKSVAQNDSDINTYLRAPDKHLFHEGAMKDLHTELADKYRELAPKIEKYKDSFLAGQLYDALEAIAIEHGAELEFKRMLAGARNSAHMDYDTNPGGFQNWFWYLPFADDETDNELAEYTGTPMFGTPVKNLSPAMQATIQRRLNDKKSAEELRKKQNAHDVAEGSQQFNKPEPYWVCVDGKKWKRFETYQQARNVHDKLEKKLRSEGSDKKVSLLAAEQLDEKQDACYRKVKSRYKVWPSAYASGALVQCRKKGAANWGNKSKK